MYRLHKWLGITALGASLAHWLLAVVPSYLVGLGWIQRQAVSTSLLRTDLPRSNGCSRHCAASAAWPWWWASGRSTWPC